MRETKGVERNGEERECGRKESRNGRGREEGRLKETRMWMEETEGGENVQGNPTNG